jgi:acyl-CoA thioesterase I
MHYSHIVRRWVLVTCCAIAGCERSAQPVTSSPPARPTTATSAAHPAIAPALPKVVFLGDSLSAGLHLPAEQAFPAVLARRLAAAKRPFQLINAGVSGDTTAGGLRRIDWLLKQAPAIVVVELGANDGLRGVPVASVAENLRAIVDKAQARGARVLLLGMRIPPSYGAAYAEAFAAIYPQVAEQTGASLVPFFMEGVAGVPERNLPDGLHPTREGHERLAENLTVPLTQLLQALPRPAVP